MVPHITPPPDIKTAKKTKNDFLTLMSALSVEMCPIDNNSLVEMFTRVAVRGIWIVFC